MQAPAPDKVLALHTVAAVALVAWDVHAGALPPRALVVLVLTCLGYVVLFFVVKRDAKAGCRSLCACRLLTSMTIRVNCTDAGCQSCSGKRAVCDAIFRHHY